MADPFKHEMLYAGRTRNTQSKTKIDAAREAILMHLRSLGFPDQILLIAFAEQAGIIYEGSSQDLGKIEECLAAVKPQGNTIVDRAFALAATHCRQAGYFKGVRALLVSDGLLLSASVDSHAKAFRDLDVALDVILIDPTRDGIITAQQVARHGTVVAVSSLGTVEESGVFLDRDTKEAQEAAALVQDYEAAFSKDLLAVPAEEKLTVAAAYPSSIMRERWYSLHVFVYELAAQSDVSERVKKISREDHAVEAESSYSSQLALARGTAIEIVPRVRGIEFNPPRMTLHWEEDVHEVAFRMRIDPGSEQKEHLGIIDVQLAPGLVLACLPVLFQMADKPSESKEFTYQTRPAFESVFISYAHADKDIVLPQVEAYRALGIKVRVDFDALQTGDLWARVLMSLIRDSDVFFLYWSEAARKSPYVEQEWQAALSYVPYKGEKFIRPVHWEDPLPEIPSELRHIHFERLQLDPSGKLSRPPVLAPMPVARKESIIAPVIPLAPDVTPDEVARSRAALGEALSFLEQTTQLRYYPVPTMLVDEEALEITLRLHGHKVPPYDPKASRYALALATLHRELAQRSTQITWKKSQPLLSTPPMQRNIARWPKWLHWLYQPSDAELERHELLDIHDPANARGWRDEADRLVSHYNSLLSFLQNQAKSSNEIVSLGVYTEDEWEVFCDPGCRWFGRNWPQLDLTASLSAAIEFSREAPAPIFDLHTLLSTSDNYLHDMDSEVVARGMAYARLATCLLKLGTSRLGAAYRTPTAENEDTLHFAEVFVSVCFAVIRAVEDSWEYNRKQLINNGHRDFQAATDVGTFLKTCIDWAQSSVVEVSGTVEKPFRSILGGWIKQYLDNLLAACPPSVTGYRTETLDDKTASLINEMDLTWDERSAARKLAKDLPFQNVLFPENSLQATPNNAPLFTEPTTEDWEHWQESFSLTKAKAMPRQVPEFCSLDIPSEAFGLVMHMIGDELRNTIDQKMFADQGIGRIVLREAPAYGIYVRANRPDLDDKLHEWAEKNRVQFGLTLPSMPRVFLLRRMEHVAEKRFQEEVGTLDELTLAARSFQTSILVHEHFHGILEHGIDADRRNAAGFNLTDSSNQAFLLNEALAAWMQLHHSRDSQLNSQFVWRYIRAGKFPKWPYRGAEVIEKLYAEEGIESVRDLIRRIRRDPESAAAFFQSLV